MFSFHWHLIICAHVHCFLLINILDVQVFDTELCVVENKHSLYAWNMCLKYSVVPAWYGYTIVSLNSLFPYGFLFCNHFYFCSLLSASLNATFLIAHPGPYLDNHLPESIHSLTKGALYG